MNNKFCIFETQVIKLKIIASLILLGVLTACSKDPRIDDQSQDLAILQRYFDLPNQVHNYSFNAFPQYLQSNFVKAQDNTPGANPTTDWGATLGRILFYDKTLSSDHTVSCASCHQQAFGFTDTARFSSGVNGITRRHSMSLVNSAYYSSGRFFWDERASSLEDQVLKPIQDAVEMNVSLDTLIHRLRNTEYYPVLFKLAFGNTEITSDKVSRALSQFVRSIVSYRSKYDQGRSQVNSINDNFPNFTASENRGKEIFFGDKSVNCSGCHITEFFVLDNPRNNGLKLVNTDSGIYIHTQDPGDIGKFKTSSLRNVGLRHRFMHDGSLTGLRSVVEHYNSGITNTPTLDPHLKDPVSGLPKTMGLSEDEVNSVVDFLNTLTDEELHTDPKFSNPWK